MGKNLTEEMLMDETGLIMRMIAETLEEALPKMTFALLIFDTKDPKGVGHCISNIGKNRLADVLIETAKLLKE